MSILSTIPPACLLIALHLAGTGPQSVSTTSSVASDRVVQPAQRQQVPVQRTTPPGTQPEAQAEELAEVPPPFQREWFYHSDRAVMWNRIVTQIGNPAPELKVDSWRGEATSLESLKGDIVVINFWATWCGPCKSAMPTMNRIAADYADKGVRIIGICDDRRAPENFEQICEQYKISFPMALDINDRANGQKYERLWFPFLVIVDREGVIRAKGLRPTSLTQALDALLEEQPPKS